MLTLALGMAVCIAVFTLAEAVLFRDLPYPNADRVVALNTRTDQKSSTGISWKDARDLAAQARSFVAVGVFIKRTWGLTDSTDKPLEVVLAGMVTHQFFQSLGVTPQLGGPFTDQYEHHGANRVAWLTHGLWKRRYAGDPNVVGKYIALNDVSYRVAGVLPAWFRFPMDGASPELYFPLPEADYCCARDARGLGAVARLAEGVSLQSAQAELAVLSDRHVRFEVVDLRRTLLGERRKPLLLLLAAVCLCMLVAAANAGGILLARVARETREAAIRVSLGAGWRHLLGERMAEGLWLALGAGTAGIAGAWALLRGAGYVPMLNAALASYAQFGEIRPDTSVLVFSIALSLCCTLLASLLPLAALRRSGVEHLLRAGSGASSTRQAMFARNALAAVQIALSVTLLVSGALILRSLYTTLNAERGYRTEQVVMAGIGIPEGRYDTDAKMIAFHERVLERLRAIPGIAAAGGGVDVPIGTLRTRFLREGEDLPKEQRPVAAIGVVSPELLSLLDIPVLHGRGFTVKDRLGQPLVALVNESFARRYLSGNITASPRLRVSFWNGQMKPWSWFQVVGVAGDTRNRTLDAPPEPVIYLSTLQVPLEGFRYMVRTRRDAASLVREFREAVRSVDRNIEAITPRPLEEHVEAGLQERRLVLWILGGFAVMALLLATAGLSAGLAASVAQRRREIGIRAALGETPAGAVARVLGGAAGIVLCGSLAGVAGALAATRVLSSQIQHVAPLDPPAIGGVLVLLAFAALAAAAAPAWRAAHIPPIEALREG
jgi:predicted permease